MEIERDLGYAYKKVRDRELIPGMPTCVCVPNLGPRSVDVQSYVCVGLIGEIK